MRWKKILRYALVIFIVSTTVLVFLAQRNTTQIYGGLTEEVDVESFVPQGGSFCITNVNLLSPDCATFHSGRTVCIEDGVITAIDSTLTRSLPTIEGSGKFLIPGLVDSHVHLFKSPNDLLLYLANGVTSIREMIGEPDHLRWRQEIQAGRIGPEMYIASPRLGSFGLIEGWFMKWTQGFNNIRDAGEAKDMVEAYAEQGYDAVKIYSHLNREAYDAVNEVAVAKGLQVVGHVPWSLEISDVINANQSEMAHLEEVMNALRREFGKFDTAEGAHEFLKYVEERSQALVPSLIEHNMSITTTLWLTKSFVRQKFELDQVLKEVELPHENPGISEWDERIPVGLGWLPHVNRYKLPNDLTEEERAWRKIFWTTYGEACAVILRVLAEGGVNIMAGTDANLPPTVPGFSLHDEMVAMKNAGMTNWQVLQSATAIPSQWMGHNTGVIELGFKANLVLLDQNPLEDISHTRSIRGVVSRGEFFDRELLDRILESVKVANDRSRTVNIDQFIKSNLH